VRTALAVSVSFWLGVVAAWNQDVAIVAAAAVMTLIALLVGVDEGLRGKAREDRQWAEQVARWNEEEKQGGDRN
jgi:hypothetical protein